MKPSEETQQKLEHGHREKQSGSRQWIKNAVQQIRERNETT